MKNYLKVLIVAASMKRVLANLTLREQIEDNGKRITELFLNFILIHLLIYRVHLFSKKNEYLFPLPSRKIHA